MFNIVLVYELSNIVENKLGFVKYWMFKLGLTIKLEFLNLAWTWIKSINNVQAWAC